MFIRLRPSRVGGRGGGLRPVQVRTAISLALPLWLASALVSAQRGGMFQGRADDPAINYLTGPLDNVVDTLNRRLTAGEVQLAFDGRSGYLPSALAALGIHVDSQLLVFSPTSLQARRINPQNPRALFFADRVALGWVRDGDVLEVAAHDRTQGIVFYALDQKPAERPQFRRMTMCLGCHSGGPTLGIPGLLMFSTRAADAQYVDRSEMVDHRNPLAERWGGWLVTGSGGRNRHLGNLVPALDSRPTRALTSAEGLFDADGYPSSHSDIAALMVFSHQAHMTNLLIRASWEARAADPALHPPFSTDAEQAARIATVMRGVAEEVVDYLLFVDEAPLADRVSGASGFAERFSASGPRDRKGRSLYEVDLRTRLLKYRCSYLIYSPAFDALPAAIKAPIYERLWQVLSGEERAPRYAAALPRADRQAIVEILRDTKSDLPAYFQRPLR